MLALSTHDTKRSEDVRARLHLLSEIPEAWEAAARRWTSANARHKMGRPHPDRVTEYFLYQTLVGAWPLPLERSRPYVEKVVREAKTHTSWIDPDERYEKALLTFLERLYADGAFQEELAAFAGRLVGPGRINALAQKLIQLTAPGVPDVYQGTELWDLSLVDPDNRRPVDFDARRRALDELEARARTSPEAILEAMDEGLPKMWVVRKALRLRRELPEAFGAEGGYRPLAVEGASLRHVVAFARGDAAVTVTPRLVLRLEQAGGWGDTRVRLPDGPWTNLLTGEEVDGGAAPLGALLARFPVALLSR
jgi:(1->4)-alpha-D-glucan 1-alpha-D-glucosylmutase